MKPHTVLEKNSTFKVCFFPSVFGVSIFPYLFASNLPPPLFFITSVTWIAFLTSCILPVAFNRHRRGFLFSIQSWRF